jgi:hypothetical protein
VTSDDRWRSVPQENFYQECLRWKAKGVNETLTKGLGQGGGLTGNNLLERLFMKV